MADDILQFLQYGAPAENIGVLDVSTTAPFLPALTLAASDCPSLIPHLLPALHSHTQVPRALAYAGLDYVEIAEAVLEVEATRDKIARVSPVKEEEDGEDEDKEHHWNWDDYNDETEEPDECHAFEVADEKERVQIAILSLRKRALQFSHKLTADGGSEKIVPHQQERNEGSIWNNEACLPELLCLLPIAVSRCPLLLSPGLNLCHLFLFPGSFRYLVATIAHRLTRGSFSRCKWPHLHSRRFSVSYEYKLVHHELLQWPSNRLGLIENAYYPVTLSHMLIFVGHIQSEQLVRGLLSASSGCTLLVTTLMNNPTMVESGALALGNILSRPVNSNDKQPCSPYASEATPSAKATAVSGTGSLSRQHSGAQSQDLFQSSTSQFTQVITSIILRLCHISPSIAAICRDALVKTCTLVEVVLYISVEIFHDELQFLSKVIFSKEKTSQWILSFFGMNQKHVDNHQKNADSHHMAVLPHSSAKEKDVPPDVKISAGAFSVVKGIAQKTRDSLLSDGRSTWKTQGWSGRLHAHLRLYCVLIRTGDLQPTHEEVDFWMRVLAGTLEDSVHADKKHPVRFVSERTLQLGISFVCLVPGLSRPLTKGLLHSCIANLLRAAMGNAPYSSCTPEVELAVWVAVHLFLHKYTDIATLVREALGMHVTVHNASMTDLSDAAGMLSDLSIAASAVAALRPRGPIPSPKKHPCLGLKCLEQLVNSTNGLGYNVDISDTVMHYISIAGEPIHPALPPIILAFTELSVPVPRSRGQRFRMRPFSCSSLIRVMSPGFAILRNYQLRSNTSEVERLSRESYCSRSKTSAHGQREEPLKKDGIGDHLATAALITYYILCRESIVRSMGIAGGSNHEVSSSAPGVNEEECWLDLLGSLPLRELLTYMEMNWPAYETLLPQWLGVASIVFPERFTAQALLQDLEKTDTAFQTHVENVPVTEDLDWVGPILTAAMMAEQPERNPAKSVVTDSERMEEESSEMDIDNKQSEVGLQKGPVKVESQLAGLDDRKRPSEKDLGSLSLEIVIAAMKDAIHNPLPVLRILRRKMTRSHLADNLEVLPQNGVDQELEVAIIKELVPHLLDISCPRCLQDQFCLWWRSLPAFTLENLVPVLLDILKDPSMVSNSDSFSLNGGWANPNAKQSTTKQGPRPLTLSTSGLVEEPLKLIACNMRVFRTPLLGIILDLLLEVLVANRRICQVAASDGGREGIKREEVAAAIVAQDSVVCQILLEACLPNVELGEEEGSGPLLEARSLICGTICSLFHRSPLLLKLLHFQGYDLRLIPMMVEGVPAMVQCLDFIGELLQQSQQQRQVFAAFLTAHLTSLHPDLRQSLAAAQQVIGHVTQMRSQVAGCARFLQDVLGAVAQCATTFPSLAPQVVALLQSCAEAGGPLTSSGPLRDAALHAAAVSAFKHLIQGKLLHGRPPPSAELTSSQSIVI